MGFEKKRGLTVSNTGFFLYCDGDRFTDYTFLSEDIANMQFKITWLPYEVNLSWIEPCLEKMKVCITYNQNVQHIAKAVSMKLFLQGVKYIE